MLESSVSLRVLAIFILFLASLGGILSSLYSRNHVSKNFVSIVNAAAAGVMLGLSLVSRSLILCLNL